MYNEIVYHGYLIFNFKINNKMKTIFLNSTVILLFFTQLIFSQEKEENSVFKNYSSSVFDKKENALNLISTASDHKETTTVDDYLKNQNSIVSIVQIGDYNQTNVHVKSEKIAVSVGQNGQNNEYSLVKSAKTISADAIQNGNHNKIDDYSYRTNYEVNTQMMQNGDNQSIKSIGTNSISKDMKVTQTGNGASVIILNKLN